MNNKVIDFIELKKLDDKPTLMMKFYPFSLLSKSYSRPKLTDFLASYFIAEEEKEKFDVFRYILEEMIDNLMKHSLKSNPVDLNLYLEGETFVIETKNFCDEYNYNTYSTFADYLNNGESGKPKYLQIVRNSALNKDKGGIGLITIITNHDANLSFDFHKINDSFIVTTICRVNL